MNVNEIVHQLAQGSSGRTEADIQSDIKLLLLSAQLQLEAGDVVTLESQVGDGTYRRIDIELGFSLIEVKRVLSATSDANRRQLAGYLKARTDETGGTYAGILTDGQKWELYRLTTDDDEPSLSKVSEHRLEPSNPEPDRLILWLETVMSTRQTVLPSPKEIEQRLGAASNGYLLDLASMTDLYESVRDDTEIQLKRSLWAKSLESAFGTQFENTDSLFINHTYLVAVAELVAHAALGFDVLTIEPDRLLSGAEFDDAGIHGVVEADFFDWIIEGESEDAAKAGERLVRGLARRVARFDWADLRHDVLKTLYESVIPQSTRHSLGEYYTPDWLADQVVQHAVDDPQRQRVLDPSCGSGTFLYHTIKLKLDESGLTGRERFDMVTSTVFGMDLHPVAATLARVTYLLALREVIADRPGQGFRVPVFLGDSLQWGRTDDDDTLLGSEGLRISTQGAELIAREMLFPIAALEDAEAFDALITDLVGKATDRQRGKRPLPAIGPQFFRKHKITDLEEQKSIRASFVILCDLHDQRRNHIWGYYIRNLARPLWLALDDNKVDVLVGNPPWLRNNAMAKPMQELFKRRSQKHDLRPAAKLVTHSDLSALFVVTSLNLYLRDGGKFGFVLPWGALGGPHYKQFRTGSYPANLGPYIEFSEPWDLLDVRPHLFPVPACVAFGSKSASPARLPDEALAWSGTIETSADHKDAHLGLTKTPTRIVNADAGPQSPYHDQVTQGATFIPRSLTLVASRDSGPIAPPHGQMSVESRRGGDKKPWSELPDLTGAIEESLLRPCYLGSSIVPFATLEPETAIVPWTGDALLTIDSPALDKFPGFKNWWEKAHKRWNQHGKGTMSLDERLNRQATLSCQFPIDPIRVVYTTSGTNLAAAIVQDENAVIDHALYWWTAPDLNAARYLTAVLNSTALLDRTLPLQPQGQFGPRHFHRYPFYPPIPTFDADVPTHMQLAKLAESAEKIATEIESSGYFVTVRKRVRTALDASGLADQIDLAVGGLLAQAPAVN